MKKILRSGLITFLLLPSLAFAANDVTLTTDVVLNVGGIVVNVSGSSATVDSIAVSGSTITAVVEAGSSLKLVAPNGNALDYTTSAAITVARACNSSASSLTLSPAVSATVTITPASDTCTSRASSSGSSSSSSGGNGPPAASSGGGGVYTPPSTPAPGNTAALQQKVQGLLGQIASLSVSFKRDLQIGVSGGADVKALQVYLNSHGFVVVASGAGSPGHETTTFGRATKAALIKLQKAAGIKPAAGYFGAKTRAYIAAHP